MKKRGGSALRGIIAAIPTPFGDSEELALDALASNIEKWNQTRLSGYAVLGTTGEFVSLTTDEKKKVLERARAVIPASKTMLAGTGEESTREAARLSRWAGEIGSDYAIVVTPHYNRWSFGPRALEEHYRRVADESTIPIVLYHIPGCTALDFAPEIIARIAEHPNIAGIKDSSGDLFALQEMRRLCPKDFRILTGAAQILHAALTVGSDGAILAEACSASDICADIVEAVEAGRMEQARALQERLAAFNQLLIGRHGIAGVKALLDTHGFYGGPCRAPLLPKDQAAVAELVEARNAVVHEQSPS